MYPDEVLRMDNRECLVMLRAQPKILKLYKITPEEFPSISPSEGRAGFGAYPTLASV